MSRSQFIANRLREVLLQGTWIANTNCKVLLESVTWEQATQKFQGLNSIAELTHHINYYVEGLLNALAKGRLEIQDKYSFDLPPIRSDADWQDLLGRFFRHAELFAVAVEDSLMDNPWLPLPRCDSPAQTHACPSPGKKIFCN